MGMLFLKIRIFYFRRNEPAHRCHKLFFTWKYKRIKTDVDTIPKCKLNSPIN